MWARICSPCGSFGWKETGSRRDTLDGRATRTVFYEHMGHRIAYTILPGAPVWVLAQVSSGTRR